MYFTDLDAVVTILCLYEVSYLLISILQGTIIISHKPFRQIYARLFISMGIHAFKERQNI